MHDDYYVIQQDIERALDLPDSDVRALRRITRPTLKTIPGRRFTGGRRGAHRYSLDDVLAWLSTVGGLLTSDVELDLRESARPLDMEAA